MTVEEHKEYASKGIAGTALGLGIAGTVGLLNQMGGCNGGLLGGLFGGNNNCCQPVCSENTIVTRYENQQSERIAILESEKTTDSKLVEVYNALAKQDKEIRNDVVIANERTNKALAELDKQTALNKQASDYQFLLLNKEIECTNGKVNCLKDRVDSITREIVPISAICPQPLSNCVPVSLQGQIIQTKDTTESVTIARSKAQA